MISGRQIEVVGGMPCVPFPLFPGAIGAHVTRGQWNSDSLALWPRILGARLSARQCSAKRSHARRKMKYWEIIADNLSKAGLSMGYVSAIDSNGRTIWIADAHCGDGKRFVVHADEK